ncbi:glycogen synthase GlgA [Reyranella sp.]|uniref:glycogen synthase GlgA n=1 Tax=Reyranella sp. TaxID=1929291 RepID=UPI003BA89BDD
MRVLFVTSEAFPLAKTGGLADVSSALPLAMARQGIDVRILMPGYPDAIERLDSPRIAARFSGLGGIEDGFLISGRMPGTDVPVWLAAAPSLFERPGGLYQDADGRDWPDNARRFGFLAQVATALACGNLVTWVPDIVHANDWHAGLVPLFLAMRGGHRPATVLTIHNLAFQGNFPPEAMGPLGIPGEYFHPGGIEFYGQMSFLKAGILFSDRVTTVSPNYAREVLTPEFGCGMEGVLRSRGTNFVGILNGIDTERWDPATDRCLPGAYDRKDLSGKQVCKAGLQGELSLDGQADRPLIGFVSRLAHQKMADVLLDSVDGMVGAGAQFALVGEGDPTLEIAFQRLADRHPGRVAVRTTYDERLAHRLHGGADILMVPARYEPCGLTQMYALRYGALPVVRNTGGLADTVVGVSPSTLSARTATGFVFEDATTVSLTGAVGQALDLYRRPDVWRSVQDQAMAQNFSWFESAAKYAKLYRELLGRCEPPLEEPRRPALAAAGSAGAAMVRRAARAAVSGGDVA